MKQILLILTILAVCPLDTQAQLLRQMFLNMPDSIAAYLSKNQRQELMDYYDMGADAVAKNMLGSDTRLDTLSGDFLTAALSEAQTLSIRLVGRQDADTVAIVVRTFHAPQAESLAYLCSTDWKSTRLLNPAPTELIAKPDTMSAEQYDKLVPLLAPYMVKADLSSVDPVLTFSLSIPFGRKDDDDALRTILLQKEVKLDNIFLK